MKQFKLLALCFGVLLLSSTSKAQIFSENFDSGIPGTWAIFDNGVGTVQSWQGSSDTYAGAGAAYVNYEAVGGSIAEDWLVTPQITPTATDYALSMYHKQRFTTDYGTSYVVKISTNSQTNPADFITVDSFTESGLGTVYEPYLLDLSAYIGQNIHIAFVMMQDDGDNWYIDELEVGVPPCLDPGNLSAANITSSSADLSWDANGANMWNVAVVPAGSGISGSMSTSNNAPYAATGLSGGTDYEYYVQADCPGATEALIITGVFDGPLTGGQPKMMELYAIGDIPDLSLYGVSSANNGTGTTAPNPELVFDPVPVTAGTFIYVTSDSAGFVTYFGFSADYESSTALINGDDAVELFKDTVVIDLFGDVNVDGTGEPWEYLDGWAYRKNDRSTTSTFDINDWTLSGINAVDGCTDNATCASQFPIGTFTTTATTPTWVGPYAFTTLCDSLWGDNAATAYIVNSTNYTHSGNTDSCYTNDALNTVHTSADVWYMLVLDGCTDSLEIDLCGAQYDSYLIVLASDGTTTLLTDDDGCGSGPSYLIEPVDGTTLSAGDTIYIVVEGFLDNQGAYTLMINQILSSNPDASFSYAVTDFCVDTAAATVTPTVTGDAGGTFSVSPAGLAVDTATGAFAPNVTGTFDVVYWVGPNPICYDADTALITISPEGDASFAYDSTSFCIGSANPNATITGTSGGTFTSSTGVVFSNASTGEIDLTSSPEDSLHMVTYMTGGACPDTLSITISIADCTVDVFQIGEVANVYSLFPNPNKGTFTIQNEGVAGEATIQVTDVLGKVLHSETVQLVNNHQVSLSNLTPGTYFVVVTDKKQRTSFKINVTR